MERIDHFFHEHSLTLTELNDGEGECSCSGCSKRLSGQIYGCSDCKFYLHKSCTQLPREIQNYFHPCPLLLDKEQVYVCSACFETEFGLAYRCDDGCYFNMHVECALLPTIESQGEELIHHFTHWKHPLTLLLLLDHKEKYLQILCSICTKKLCSDCDSGSDSDSSATAYGCGECNFFIHKSCMINMPRQIFNHGFHPSCADLVLFPSPYEGCCGCDGDAFGLAFRCRSCGFRLCLKCALLPTIDSKVSEYDEFQHFAHPHPLQLGEFGSELGCGACGENCLGPCFGCPRCNFILHKSCIAELELEISHPFHPLHPLTLYPIPIPKDPDQTFGCAACRGRDERILLVYQCDNCEFNLHISCTKPKRYLKYEGHPHYLTFFDKTCQPFHCHICGKAAQSCFFRCVACEFNIHVYCLPSTPKTIKHKRHLHPLNLTESPFEFELNGPINKDSYHFWSGKIYLSCSDDDFYCDACEEIRLNRWESVYYCEECKFIAETNCVISELLPSLTISEDKSVLNVTSLDKEKSVLEGTFLKLNNEITELKAKEQPLKAEIEKLRATLQTLEEELQPINKRLEELEKDHFLCEYYLKEAKQ